MMAHTEYYLLKLSKDELESLILDYQVKFDDVLKSVKGDMFEMKKEFTKLESELRYLKILLITV